MTSIYYKTDKTDTSGPVWALCTPDGRIDFSLLGQKFGFDPTSIKLNGSGFPIKELESKQKWEQIRDLFKEDELPVGAEDDPVVVTGEAAVPAVSTGPSATPSTVDHLVASLIFGSFDLVPTSPTEVNLLTELLKRPLVRKIPIFGDPEMLSHGEIFEASTVEAAPWLVQFFRVCLTGPLVSPGRGDFIASTYWALIFSLMEKIGKDFLWLPMSTYSDTEDISSSANFHKKRRNLLINLNGQPGTGGVPVLLAEHKDKSLGDAKSELESRYRGSNASVYGELGYLLGYAAGDGKVQFYILPVPGGIAPAPLLRELDLREHADRTTLAIVVTNILRWMHSLYRLNLLCSTRIPLLVSTQRVDPWSIKPVILHIGLNHVMKKFSLPGSAYEHFKELYSYLHGEKIPHAAKVKKVLADEVQLYEKKTGRQKKKLKNSCDIRNIELHIEPVGCPVDPETLSSEKVVQMTREVLLCLEALHERGFCHYDVRLTNIISWRQKFYVIDFELAGKTKSSVELQLNFPGWGPKFKHVYDEKNDLYMLGEHVIKECRNSPTELMQLGDDLVDCKCATAKDAKERLLALFPV